MKALMPLPLSALTLRMNLLREIPDAKGKTDNARLRTMRKTSLESDFIKKSEGEKIFRSMLDEQYAILSAKSGRLGLGEMIYQQLKSNLKK